MIRYLSILCGLALLTLVALGHGVRSGQRHGSVAEAFAWADEQLRLAQRKVQAAAGIPYWFFFPSRRQGSGVTQGADLDDGTLILLTGYFPDSGDHIRLVRRDGTVVAHWNLEGVDKEAHHLIHGISMAPDGSPTFTLLHHSLVGLDRCGQVSLQMPGNYHHQVVPAQKGGWWTLDYDEISRREADADYLPPHTSDFFRSLDQKALEEFGWPHLQDETVVRLGPGGEVLQKFSIARLLYESGLRNILQRFRRVGQRGLTHSNSVQELSAEMAPAFPMFAAGDLLLSLRELHMLLVVDPNSLRIKWHQIGPWAWQHDPQFQPDGTISLYNNAHRPIEDLAYPDPDSIHLHNPGLHSNILRVNPADGDVQVVAGREISEASHFYTINRGQHQMLPGGDVLLAAPEEGRALQLNARGDIVWEYINRRNRDQVSVLMHAYHYPAGYFRVEDWSCPAG